MFILAHVQISSHFSLSQLKIHFLKRHLALSVIWQDFCKNPHKKTKMLDCFRQMLEAEWEKSQEELIKF